MCIRWLQTSNSSRFRSNGCSKHAFHTGQFQAVSNCHTTVAVQSELQSTRYESHVYDWLTKQRQLAGESNAMSMYMLSIVCSLHVDSCTLCRIIFSVRIQLHNWVRESEFLSWCAYDSTAIARVATDDLLCRYMTELKEP